jgi:2',3'-cyclic-nucleotide 2'-phosphodiesterase (5'-nucleotidase family)
MVRQIVVPEQTRLVINLPEEYVGQSVEVLAFPLTETANQPASPPTDAEKQARIERLNNALEEYTFNSGGYRFNREEANDYD